MIILLLVIGDSDHIGGLFYILENMKVKNVVISIQKEEYGNIKRLFNILKERKINLIVVSKGDILKIENNLYFDIIWPDKSNLIADNSINNNSLVCKLNYKEFSMLFTGDIEKVAEEKILLEYKDNQNILNSTVLKVAHHGSDTSSIEEFIKAVKPKFALIGVGKNNKFGHPNIDVINRLKDFGSRIFRTDENGEIIISVDMKFSKYIVKNGKK